MKNREVMRKIFGFGFRSTKDYDIYCTDTPCYKCPLNNRCSAKGIREFMDEEYKPYEGEGGINMNGEIDENSEAYKAIFEKGRQAGMNEVYDSLAKIFERKSE